MAELRQFIDLTTTEWRKDYPNPLSTAEAFEILTNTQSYLKILERWSSEDAELAAPPRPLPLGTGRGAGLSTGPETSNTGL